MMAGGEMMVLLGAALLRGYMMVGAITLHSAQPLANDNCPRVLTGKKYIDSFLVGSSRERSFVTN